MRRTCLVHFLPATPASKRHRRSLCINSDFVVEAVEVYEQAIVDGGGSAGGVAAACDDERDLVSGCVFDGDGDFVGVVGLDDDFGAADGDLAPAGDAFFVAGFTWGEDVAELDLAPQRLECVGHIGRLFVYTWNVCMVRQ